MTREQAVRLARSGWWKDLPAREIVGFQLFEPRLCMNFDDFHGAVEEALERPVFTHELADVTRLRAEFLGDTPAEILARIPDQVRTLLVVTPPPAEG